MLSQYNHINYTPSPQVIQTLLAKTENVEAAYSKILRLLVTSPALELTQETIQRLLTQVKAESIKQTRFSWIVKLLISRQSQQKLGAITSSDLLAALAQGLEYRIANKLYSACRKDQSISDWAAEIQKTLPNTQETHFAAAIFSLSFSLPALFGHHLLQLNNQDKIIKTLLYLEQCPEDYRFATVAHLQTLDLKEDLRARLAEFTHSTTDPTQVETE